MPRKKTIDLEHIKWKDINTEIVEKKDCFGVSIQFNEALGPEEIKVLRGYYKCNVSSDGLTLTRPVKNSWKGAMMSTVHRTFQKWLAAGFFEKIWAKGLEHTMNWKGLAGSGKVWTAAW